MSVLICKCVPLNDMKFEKKHLMCIVMKLINLTYYTCIVDLTLTLELTLKLPL